MLAHITSGTYENSGAEGKQTHEGGFEVSNWNYGIKDTKQYHDQNGAKSNNSDNNNNNKNDSEFIEKNK